MLYNVEMRIVHLKIVHAVNDYFNIQKNVPNHQEINVYFVVQLLGQFGVMQKHVMIKIVRYVYDCFGLIQLFDSDFI